MHRIAFNRVLQTRRANMDADRLYNAYLSGDPAALESLMKLYGDRLTLYINGYVKNLHDAEDLLIEVFAYLVAKRPHIRENFNGYLYKAARNQAFMFLRKQKNQLLFSIKEPEFHFEDTFENTVLENERNAQLYKCLDCLSPAQKEALYLVYIEGMGYKDAAKILHKTAKQVDKLLQLGKKNMKPLLETEGIRSAFNE